MQTLDIYLNLVGLWNVVGCGGAPCHLNKRNCCCSHHRLGRGRKAAALLGRIPVLDPNIGIEPSTGGSVTLEGRTRTKDYFI